MVRATSLAVAYLALGAGAAAADGIRIDHQAAQCVVAERFPVLRARLQPADAVQRAKVYFRSGAGPHWYAVPMRAAGDIHEAVLPRPKKGLASFTYYIEAVDRHASVVRTAEAVPVVVGSAVACRGGAVAGAAEAAAVALEAPAGAPAARPAGCSATGVTTTTGAAAVAGSAAGVAAAGAGAAAATGGGVGGTALVVGGLAAAGAATAAVVATRDGGGPCTEGGGFEFSAESSLEGGDWACTISHTLVFRVRNHSCQELSFGPGSHHRVETHRFGTNRTPDSGFTLDDVDPGDELVHRESQAPFIACRNPQAGPPPPGGDRRTVEWLFAIPSNLGPATDVVRFSFDFAVCPPCPN